MSGSSSSGISGVQTSEEPAGTHALKSDRTTGEMLLAVGCRDVRPLVDSGSVVSTYTVDYATSVSTEKVNKSMNLESVLGDFITTLWRQAQCSSRQPNRKHHEQFCLCTRAVATAL